MAGLRNGRARCCCRGKPSKQETWKKNSRDRRARHQRALADHRRSALSANAREARYIFQDIYISRYFCLFEKAPQKNGLSKGESEISHVEVLCPRNQDSIETSALLLCWLFLSQKEPDVKHCAADDRRRCALLCPSRRPTPQARLGS